jgi:hypothetical protein
MRAHGYPFSLLVKGIVRSVGGAVVSLLRGNIFMTRVYLIRIAGTLRGYFLGASDLRKVVLSERSSAI